MARQHDDVYKRRLYKDMRFNGKRTMRDDYTGEKVYFSNGKINKHKNTVDIDHIIPIDRLKKRYPTLTDEQIKKIANSEYNYAVTNSSLNRSKGALLNHEVLIRDQKKAFKKLADGDIDGFTQGTKDVAQKAPGMLQKTVKPEVNSRIDATKFEIENRTQNISETTKKATNTGVQAAIMVAVASSIENVVLVANGEKDAETAVVDVGKSALIAGVSAGGTTLLQTAITNVVSEQCANFVVGQAMPAVMLSVSVVNAVNGYAQGKISQEELTAQIITNGAGMFAYSLTVGATGGNVLVATVVSTVTTMVAGQICKTMLEYKNANKLNQERQREFDDLIRQSLEEIEYQRMNLQQAIEAENKKWDLAFTNGFDSIFEGTVLNDANKISDGLDNILEVFNKNVKFATLEEFNDFFDDELAILKL